MVRIAINGFGRIGRLVLRVALTNKNVDVVAINDLGSVDVLAHLLKYDSVHGILDKNICAKNNVLYIDKKKIPVYAQKDPGKLPWKKHRVDVVCESTGRFRKKQEAMKHLKAGAKKVLISAPPKGTQHIKTIVKGINEKDIVKKDVILSNGSCTTNCLAPIAHVLHKQYGIEHGLLNTIHSYTATQKIVDGPAKDFRRARAAAINMLPTTTGAAESVVKVLPELKGKIDGMSTRVPLACGSMIDFTCTLNEKTSKEELDMVFRTASRNKLRGVLQFSDDPLVSSDIVHNPYSAIYDSQATMVLSPQFVKIIAWYDNEWGFSNRMVDVMKIMYSCKTS